jgi:hypothetical protein
MIGGGTGETGFRARTGAVTLMFALGSDREDALEILEAALGGGLLEAAEDEYVDDEDEEYEDEEEEYDLDEEEVDEDENLLELLPPVLLESQAALRPRSAGSPSPKGIQFLFVVSALERWLRNCPSGAIDLTVDSGSAVATFACCWSATVTHALAALPLTLPELHRTVAILDYETVKEHVRAMESDELVESRTEAGETRYSLSEWAREGIAPLIAAARYEAHYPMTDVAPPDILDVEAAFQMALPPVILPPSLRGSCRLGVQVPGGEGLIAGATAEVGRGRVLSSSTLLERQPENWVAGSPLDWMEAVVDPSTERLSCGGDRELAGALIEGLHESLFGTKEDTALSR